MNVAPVHPDLTKAHKLASERDEVFSYESLSMKIITWALKLALVALNCCIVLD